MTEGKQFQNAAKFPQYAAAIIANLASFLFGAARGWTSTSESPLVDEEEYGFPVSTNQFSWIGSAMPLGCLVGCPIYGWGVTNLGRKRFIHILCVPSIVGFLMIDFAHNVTVMCVGRILLGIAIGGLTVALPLYTGEFAETHIRGKLGAYFQILATSGILFSYVVGSLISVFWLSIVCTIIPVLHGLLLFFIPESPIYYLEQNMDDKARKSLQWFRGSDYNIEEELNTKKKNIEDMKAAKLTTFEAFSSKAAKKGLIIGIGLVFFRQFCGASGVIFYNTVIFKEAGSTMNPNIETIILGTVDLIFTFFSSIVVDSLGRRPLLIFSSGGMAISTFFIAVYFFLKDRHYDVQSFAWIPLVFLSVFVLAFSLGFGPLPWVFLGEIFPRRIAGYAVSIVSIINSIFVFIVTYSFEDISSLVGRGGQFFIFSGCTTMGLVFCYCLVIETKNKPLEQIIQELENEQKNFF